MKTIWEFANLDNEASSNEFNRQIAELVLLSSEEASRIQDRTKVPFLIRLGNGGDHC